MSSTFLLYGATGFVGSAVARLAVRRGLHPILAGRNGPRVEALAAELSLEFRVFHLEDAMAVDRALRSVTVVLNCAGPFVHTSTPVVDGCLCTGAHYLDISGEIPAYEALAARDAEARDRGVMVLPGAGFDVVPTDCLASQLKERLPSATHLRLAFYNQGPAGMPPGSVKTAVEMRTYGTRVRRDGRLELATDGATSRMIDFGDGPVEAHLLTWGDLFMGYYNTGIPNIEVYAVRPAELRVGSTASERTRTHAHVWGEVEDNYGRKAMSRLHGPEASVSWTSLAALAAVEKVLAGDAPAGFRTPALAYGPDFVLECEGVRREDLD
jgi:short subunit dehydrogenase-like uncharacterized protein